MTPPAATTAQCQQQQHNKSCTPANEKKNDMTHNGIEHHGWHDQKMPVNAVAQCTPSSNSTA